ncbi:MAG: type II toxin-antitoxin system Phd/YefM family antitoxin [Candidatus Binatia bacterium]
MAKSVSIVEARRDLGRLADEVRRTGQAVVLTRRGRPVARLAPHAASPAKGASPGRPLAGLRGSVQLLCTPEELLQAVRDLRREFALSLERRSSHLGSSPRRRHG